MPFTQDILHTQSWTNERDKLLKTRMLALKNIEGKLERLTDAYLDATLDKETFLARKESLHMEQRAVRETLTELEGKNHSVPDQVSEFLELSKIVYSSYILGFPEEKREILQNVTSNRSVEGKNLYLSMKSPYREVENHVKSAYGDVVAHLARTHLIAER